MRQITASEASNDEMERQRFEHNYAAVLRTPIVKIISLRCGARYEYTVGDRLNLAWAMWQAALKSKQGEI